MQQFLQYAKLLFCSHFISSNLFYAQDQMKMKGNWIEPVVHPLRGLGHMGYLCIHYLFPHVLGVLYGLALDQHNTHQRSCCRYSIINHH
jgi:hypothetical protein